MSIVLTEEGTVIVPHKILYRYFEILEIPLLLIFLNNKDRLRLSPIVWKIYVLIFGGLLGYYIGTNQRTAIMDAPYAQAVYAYFPVDIIDISSKTPLSDTSLNSLYIIWDENQQTYVTSTSIPYH